eukprot:CAMPEP_0114697974 /NCGR_PEP_ID=MMETSP0191-20121206/74375_1 /TAXON_ID=126664 /ORGANISM="Sorites sp." /LENGTH=119 /DNA_ID=CAMNT_0001997715 /DNA_START=100 /DNA_END=459 /DNA_ORIENTATION=+
MAQVAAVKSISDSWNQLFTLEEVLQVAHLPEDQSTFHCHDEQGHPDHMPIHQFGGISELHLCGPFVLILCRYCFCSSKGAQDPPLDPFHISFGGRALREVRVPHVDAQFPLESSLFKPT